MNKKSLSVYNIKTNVVRNDFLIQSPKLARILTPVKKPKKIIDEIKIISVSFLSIGYLKILLISIVSYLNVYLKVFH